MYEDELLARNELIEKMKDELLGPGSEPFCIDPEHEVISSKPEQRYSVGILFPRGVSMKMEDDDTEGEDIGHAEGMTEDERKDDFPLEEKEDVRYRGPVDSEDTMDETISMSTKLLPSSMGIQFISDKIIDTLLVDVSFATYRNAIVSDCKIKLDEELTEGFRVPDVFQQYFHFDDSTHELSLIQNFDRKQIRYWYESDQVDDGTFKPFAYKLLDLLKYGYVREPAEYHPEISFVNGDYYNPSEGIEKSDVKLCALRYDMKNGYYSYTIMLVNVNSGKGKKSIFQPTLHISTEKNNGLHFCEYDVIRKVNDYDDEEKSNSLLYRKKKSFGTGLGVGVSWNINDKGEGYIQSDFFPRVEVPQMEFGVDPEFYVENSTFSMKYLSDLVEDEKTTKIDKLESLSRAYASWIELLVEESASLPSQYGETAKKHIDNCKYCLGRINKGIEVLRNNQIAWDAFQLANRAMYMQRIQVGVQERFDNVYPDISPESDELGRILENMDYYETEDKCFWRPFQIAFLLMCVKATTDDSNKNNDRNMVDLIWFPTGGGKTEAYLGLTAFTIFYRRLAHHEESGGTTVIMRYTLRLLASQQFTRAATLICACELIRQEAKKKRSYYPKYVLGDESITIGLWIGGEHTPNRITGKGSAKECYDSLANAQSKDLNYVKERSNKFQVLKCPWCGTKLVKDLNEQNKIIGQWGYRMQDGKHFFISCTHPDCAFENRLPLQVVDEELYSNPPTLLFATVDKFAMMPWYADIGSFFAAGNENRTPELIIQDELHLISGPLGSMVGIYETVIDYLCSRKGVYPKIIASTATICRAKEQCSSLYNREVFQFPPQGLDEADSFFARAARTDDKFGRVYVGLLPAGKTKAMMEGKVLASILQSEMERRDDDRIKDCYWTLTVYFNSLRELGKCSTIVQNDVRDNIRRMANRAMFYRGIRNVLRSDELTSRVSTTELNQTLHKLEKIHYSSDPDKKTYPSNVLLATNMISVGIDVDRLNLMVMVGQPKLTSEYIQASSRVGRRYPGVVFTMYDGARSRDRSHYEQFKTYHESFYRYVEPTGVTPFSEPARKRALHAVVLSFIRHGMGLGTDADISTFDREEMSEQLMDITKYITTRMENINNRMSFHMESEKDQAVKEIDLIYEKIGILADQSDHNLEYGNIMGYLPKDNNRKRLMKPYGTAETEELTFDTMTSMRNVDSPVNVSIVIPEDTDGKAL